MRMRIILIYKQSPTVAPSKLIDEKKVEVGIQQILKFQKMRIPAPRGNLPISLFGDFNPRNSSNRDFQNFLFFGLVSFLVFEKIQIERIALFGKFPIRENLSLSSFLISHIMLSIRNMYIIANRQQNARVFLKKV